MELCCGQAAMVHVDHVNLWWGVELLIPLLKHTNEYYFCVKIPCATNANTWEVNSKVTTQKAGLLAPLEIGKLSSDALQNAPYVSYAINNAPDASSLLKNSLITTHQDSVSTLVQIGKLSNASDTLQYTPDVLDAFNNAQGVFNALELIHSSTLVRDRSTLIPVATLVNNCT
jgi:hypothetical protein